MAESSENPSKAEEKALAEQEKAVKAAEEKGYFGETHSPFDNKEFSLESGPDSPSALDQEIAVHEARIEALKGSRGDN